MPPEIRSRRSLRRLLAWMKSSWPQTLSAALGAVLALGYFFGGFAPFDRFLLDSTFSLSARRAGNDLLVIEIDRKSLQSLNTWPWPRAFHAALLDRLRQDGARLVAFDIDFSSASTSSGDKAFARAIAAMPDKVVLPSFVQAAGVHGSGETTVAFPIELFRAHALLGVVNVFPDSDGRLRRYQPSQGFRGGTPPTMVDQLLAGEALDRQASGDQGADGGFYIDYGIRPDSVAHVSYVDALTGRYDRQLVAGRRVLVGATALELGDQFAVPRYGFLSGVDLQALAYESIVQDRAIAKLGPAWTLVGLGVITWLAHLLMIGRWRRVLGVALVLTLIIVGLQVGLQVLAAVAVDAAPWLAAVLGCLAIAITREAELLATAAQGLRDATRRQEALTRSVFSDSSDGIMVVNAQGLVEAVNPAAERFLEQSAATIINNPLALFLPGLGFTVRGGTADGAAPLTLAREIVMTLPGRGEIVLAVLVTKSRLQIEAAAAEPSAAATDIYVVTMSDITARRAAQSAHEHAMTELKAAALAKSRFLASISHELRTPLNAIIGFSSLISQQGLGPVGNSKYADYAVDINESGHRLLQLVNDVIDLSRIEAGEYEIKRDYLDLESLLNGCLHELRQIASCQSRTFDIEIAAGTAEADGDPRAIRKALVNLLSNAVKFTKPNGQIVLRAVAAPGRQLALEVQDDGIGIEKPMLDRIMEPFSQISGGFSRSHDGMGIGLHVVNRLINLHGGSMEISSEPGAGTTVRLILPGKLAVAGTAA